MGIPHLISQVIISSLKIVVAVVSGRGADTQNPDGAGKGPEEAGAQRRDGAPTKAVRGHQPGATAQGTRHKRERLEADQLPASRDLRRRRVRLQASNF